MAQIRSQSSKKRLKSDYDRRFSELLTDLGLHQPPCRNLAANNVYYLLGVLAYDLLQSIKLLYLPEGHQPKRVRSPISTQNPAARATLTTENRSR
ncbi:hypothetical protein EGM51_08570 [Verrucomicrobia bacterium S94]|nr:hypothetical protein EGM51_08570 [Verrucomicrobia bacterium S94]